MIDVEKTIAAAGAELDRLEGAQITIVISPTKAVAILSLIQLALRYPEMPIETRTAATQFKDNLVDLISRASPILGDFCRLGDNPSNDIGTAGTK